MADWRICERTAKLNSANIPCCHFVGGVWKLLTTSVRDECEASFEDGVVQVLTRERLTYPTKVPSLSDKQVEKTNAEVKRAQEEDTSGRGK